MVVIVGHRRDWAGVDDLRRAAPQVGQGINGMIDQQLQRMRPLGRVGEVAGGKIRDYLGEWKFGHGQAFRGSQNGSGNLPRPVVREGQARIRTRRRTFADRGPLNQTA
jgi:hypothetical protein